MRITAMNRVQRGKLAMAAAAIGVGLLSVTGCGFVNAQQTSHQYAASDGIKEDVGPVQLRNLLIVSTGSDKPGRVVGAVFNTSSSDVTLTLNGASGSQTQIQVKANSSTLLNDSTDEAILSRAGAAPGALAPVTATVSGVSREIKVPVVDGSLAEYRGYLPAGATPTGTATSTGTASPKATQSAAH